MVNISNTNLELNIIFSLHLLYKQILGQKSEFLIFDKIYPLL